MRSPIRLRPRALLVDAADTLRRLRGRGARVAVLSNWDTRLRDLLAALDLGGALDASFISGELGIEKPDPRIFRLACLGLGVPPAAALHVGDSARADVAGARAAGCQALHFGSEVTTFPQILDKFWD